MTTNETKKPFIDKRPDAVNTHPDVASYPQLVGYRRLWSKKNQRWYYGSEPNGSFARYCDEGLPDGSPAITSEWITWAGTNNVSALVKFHDVIAKQSTSTSTSTTTTPVKTSQFTAFVDKKKASEDVDSGKVVKKQKTDNDKLFEAIQPISTSLSALNNLLTLHQTNEAKIAQSLAEISKAEQGLLKQSKRMLNSQLQLTIAMNKMTAIIKEDKTQKLLDKLYKDDCDDGLSKNSQPDLGERDDNIDSDIEIIK